MHYFSLHIGDYRRDTMNLDFDEHGIYLLMIQEYMLNETLFSNDLSEVYWELGLKSEKNKEICKNLLKKFFIQTKKGYKHKRCDEEIAKYRDKSDKARNSASMRWDSKRNANAMRTHSEGNANHKPITNTHKPITNIHIKSKPLSENRTGEVITNIENDFNTFWEAYPKKKGRKDAKKHWLKIKPNLETVLQALDWQVKSDDWVKENGEYIPMGSTYVSKERWEDEKQLTKIEKLIKAI